MPHKQDQNLELLLVMPARPLTQYLTLFRPLPHRTANWTKTSRWMRRRRKQKYLKEKSKLSNLSELKNLIKTQALRRPLIANADGWGSSPVASAVPGMF